MTCYTVNCSNTNLTIQTKDDDHDEEENGPQWSRWELSDSLRVSDEDKTWSCAKTNVFMSLSYVSNLYTVIRHMPLYIKVVWCNI